jgi:hypothetical protein
MIRAAGDYACIERPGSAGDLVLNQPSMNLSRLRQLPNDRSYKFLHPMPGERWRTLELHGTSAGWVLYRRYVRACILSEMPEH